MAETIKPQNLTACPVCGARMEKLSQQGGFIAAGCKPCHFSISVTTEMWAAAKAARDAMAPVPPAPPAPKNTPHK
jgi:hypothetical protein